MVNPHTHRVQIVSDNNLKELFHWCEVASAHVIHFLVKRPPAREPVFYFLPATPSRAGLCKAFGKNTASGARKIFAETRKAPALLNPAGTGLPLQAGIKKRTIHLPFPLPVESGA